MNVCALLRYVATVSIQMSPHYKEIIADLKKVCETKQVRTMEQANAWLVEAVEAWNQGVAYGEAVW